MKNPKNKKNQNQRLKTKDKIKKDRKMWTYWSWKDFRT